MGGKYDDLSAEQLRALLVRRDAERKLGLVWERSTLAESASGDFVVLDLADAHSHQAAPYGNLLIEGDNKDALRVLVSTHRHAIDCIYIDPPYNTGNRDFIYNDRFVGKDDVFRQSLWLEFMHERLLLAARTLKPDDGVIFASIDDRQLPYLRLLMDQVFPNMHVGTFAWRRRGNNNAAREYFFSQDHEHVLCYAGPNFSFSGDEKQWNGYANPDGDPRGPWASDNLTLGFTSGQRPNLYYPLYDPVGDVWYPCDPNRVWAYASQVMAGDKKVRTSFMEEFVAEGKVLFPAGQEIVVFASLAELLDAIANRRAHPFLSADMPNLEFWVGRRIGTGKPRFKRHQRDLQRTHQPLSSWIRPASGTKSDENMEERTTLETGYSEEGSKALRRLLGRASFDYPKPPSLIASLLKQATRPDAVVMDFFAGSATTAEAVLRLNAEDGGNRRFIMVSKTEATDQDPGRNVCRDVAAVRIGKVIDDLSRNQDGVFASFAYLRCRSMRFNDLDYDLDDPAIWTFAQLSHDLPLTPFDPSRAVQVAHGPEGLVAYCDSPDQDAITELAGLARNRRIDVYTWMPGKVRDAIPSADVHGLPEAMLQGFPA